MHNVLYGIYLLVLLLSSLCSLWRFSKLDIATKIFSATVVIGFIDELLSYFAACRYHNNIPEYNIFSLLEFLMLNVYFNYSFSLFKKYNIGYFVGIIGCLIGIIDIAHHSINRLDSNFLFLDGIIIITIGLCSFAWLIVNDEDLQIKYYPHFWLTICIIFYWAFTFLSWGLYNNLKDRASGMQVTDYIELPANIIAYLGIGIVFLLYPKMSKQND